MFIFEIYENFLLLKFTFILFNIHAHRKVLMHSRHFKKRLNKKNIFFK